MITNIIQNIFINPEKNPISISSHSPFLPPSNPWQPLIYCVSLWIFLFFTFHINGIRTSLVVQWLRLCAPSAGGTCLILGWGRSRMPCGMVKKINK